MLNKQQNNLQSKKIEHFAFNLNDILGEGAFGKVYKGINEQTQEIVAIKMIPKHNPNISISMVEQEVQNLQAFNSNHIIKIHKFTHTANNIYIIVEYCNGGDLEGYIQKQKNKCVEESEAVNIIKQICEGFKEMHKKNYVHRDLKPANIMINNNEYKLGDLGLSKSTKGQQMLQTNCGTPLYMSPQLLKGEYYSEKTDIWSLGLIFYEILFGKYPWVMRDMRGLINAVTNNPTVKFPIDKPISKTVKEFIQNCLRPEENDRYSWEDIFKHPLFTSMQRRGSLDIQYKQYQQCGSNVRNLIQQLQEQAKHKLDQNLYIKNTFHQLDQNRKGYLDQNQFYQFLQRLNPNTCQIESNEIYNLIDENKDGQVSFEEFKVLFDEYDFAELNDHSGEILKEIRAIIQIHQINIKQTFQSYSSDNKEMNLVEFTKFINLIAKGIKKDEIKMVFEKFDHDGDGSISFQEFYDTIHNKIETQKQEIIRRNSSNDDTYSQQQGLDTQQDNQFNNYYSKGQETESEKIQRLEQENKLYKEKMYMQKAQIDRQNAQIQFLQSRINELQLYK